MRKVGILISEAMNNNPVTISPEVYLPVCARKMLSNNIGGIIVKEKGELVGIVTEKDIVEEAVGKELDVKKKKVRDIMTTGMIKIEDDKDIAEAVELMIREDVRRLPIINGNKLVGILTAKDVLKIQPKLYDKLHDCLVKKTKK